MLLVVTPNYKGEVKLLAEAASTLGWDVYHDGWRIPKHLLHQPGAVYGEQFFCEAVAEQMGWKLLSNPLDWLTSLPEEYTNRKVSFTTLAQARNLLEKKFVKPADDKVFPSKIYESGSDLPTNPILNDTPVLVSDVMTFTSEYRCFIKNNKVVSVCCYLYKDVKATEPEINNPERYNNNVQAVTDVVNKMLADERVKCVPGSVIDLGRFKRDTYAIIETNPVYASGLYGCEIVASLDAIKAACVCE